MRMRAGAVLQTALRSRRGKPLHMIGHRLLGHGPEKVLVLHGWMADHSVFEPLFPALSHEKFTYAFVDYRGYGRSRTMSGDYSIAEIGSDTISLADHLGWQNFQLIGHSMGGLVLQWIAARCQTRVLSGVAITPIPANGLPIFGRDDNYYRQAAESARHRATILHYTTGKRYTRAWLHAMVERSLATTTPRAFAGYYEAWSHTNIVEQVRGLNLPLLVIVGEHDPGLHAQLMRETYLRWWPNARLNVLPNAGHYPMIETPIILATLCEQFMGQQRVRAKPTEGTGPTP